MNLFENILSKAKSGVDYLASGQLGSDIFDATYKGGDPTQTIPYKAVNTAARGISNVTWQWMEDKTQSLAYKTIQWWANLYTWVKNRIQETAQDDKNAFDAQISQKRQQFISDMLAKWKKKEDIFSALNSLKEKWEFDYKPWITGSIVSGLGNRMQSLQDTTENLSKIENPIERTLAWVIPYAGQTVATPLQPIASALEPFISPVVQKVIEKTGQSENIQELSKWWAEFEKTNPILAENIAGLLNVWQIAPVPFVKPVTSAVWKWVIATGKAISKWTEAVAPKVVQGAKMATNIVAAPVKSIVNTARKYVTTPEEISGIQSAIKPKQRVKNGVVQRSQDAINNEITLTNSLIRQSGKKPADLATYKTAIKGEMEKIGAEINRLTGQDLTIDITPSTAKLRQLANSDIVKTLDPADTNAILGLADRLDANGGRMSLSMAEEMNQWLNSVLKDTTVPKSEAYKRGLMTLVEDIRNGLDESISNIPWQFKEIKKAYWALRNVYGDTVAREIVFNRQNMGGLVDSIGAIEWAWNIVSGGGKMLMGDLKWWAADIGRGIASNAVGRFIKSKNDPNNIIRAIFEKEGKKSIMPNIPNKPTNGNIPTNITNTPTPVDIPTVSKTQQKVVKPKKSVVVPKAPIVKKETIVKPKEVNGNIRAIWQSKDFIEYFRKDLWDNVTIDWLKKFWFTESQIKDNSYNFLKSKDNPLWVSLEDLFYIAKWNSKWQTPAWPTTINTMGKRVIKKAPESPVALERGYTTSIKKPIVKRSADVESGLIEEARKLWKYDKSYDVVGWKELYRWGSEDWAFWTDDIDIAKSFWDEWAIKKKITIKKPLDVRSKDIREFIKKNSDINIDDATSAYSRSLSEFNKLMKWAKERWYDWIIWKTSDNWLNFTWNEFVLIK